MNEIKEMMEKIDHVVSNTKFVAIAWMIMIPLLVIHYYV